MPKSYRGTVASWSLWVLLLDLTWSKITPGVEGQYSQWERTLALSGIFRLWLENIWWVMESGCGQSRPNEPNSHQFFCAILEPYLDARLHTSLEIFGLICNLQGCSGFGTHCVCKSSIDCTEKYSLCRKLGKHLNRPISGARDQCPEQAWSDKEILPD